MLIRVSGHHDGVKAYLEEGRKVGRETTRDEMDERVVLDGDLDITDALIQSIDAPPNVDRYLTLTLSFKEDNIDRATLDAVVREFKAFVFAAYRPDELNFYAEAHLPRIKSYLDESTGTLVERKPHIHIVIPKLNLITGQRARPFGFDKLNLDYIDAIQEHLNAKYGLASPKENRRADFTDRSEMISRYRADLFKPASRELKDALLDAVLDQRIESWPAFEAMLAEQGEVRVRNAGKDTAYPNLKTPGVEKGVNLKDYVFSRDFIELPTDEKLAHLSADAVTHYETTRAPRATDDLVQARLDEWHATRARELKYLNSGNTQQWARYQESSQSDRVLMLDNLERGFYAQHLKEFHDDTSGFGRLGPDDLERPFDTPHGPGAGDAFDIGHGNTFGSGPDDGPGFSSGLGFTPDGGAGPLPGFGPDLDSGFGGDGIEYEYDIEFATAGADRDATAGAEQSRAQAGWPSSVAAPLDIVRAVPGGDLVRLPGGRAVLLPGDAHNELEPERPLSAYRMRRVRDRDREFAQERSGTGRVADNALAQHARDAREARRLQHGESSEFAEIRQQLSAERLLAELSHTHGVLPQKYVITQGRDGGARIRAGRRNLNVSDFLTKEMYLPWKEAAPLLRAVYQRQQAGLPVPQVRELPRAMLWREFALEREQRALARRAAWETQRQRERDRRAAIAADLVARRTQIRDESGLRGRDRQAAMAAARLQRAVADTALSKDIRGERDVLKAIHGDAAGMSFTTWLRERAQGGDERALAELRRVGKVDAATPAKVGTPAVGTIKPAARAAHEDNAILYSGAALSLSVDAGGSVSYRRDGEAWVVDRGDAVEVLRIDREAIETGLRLAQMKFGRTLELEGGTAFRQAAIEVAAAAGLPVQFSEAGLNRALDQARHTRVGAQLADVRTSIDGASAPAASPAVTPPVAPTEKPALPGATPADNLKPGGPSW